MEIEGVGLVCHSLTKFITFLDFFFLLSARKEEHSYSVLSHGVAMK